MCVLGVSMCMLCACAVQSVCSPQAYGRFVSVEWRNINALFWRTYHFPAFSPGLFLFFVLPSVFVFFFFLSLLQYKVLVPGGPDHCKPVEARWNEMRSWTDFMCPSQEQAEGMVWVNSPQVYIYIQYLFIYFSVYLYVCFFLVVQSMH